MAAIAGMEVDLAVLALAAGDRRRSTGGDVVAGTDELVAAGLLTAVEGARPAYQFSHAIVRDTVADGRGAERSGRLHLAVAHGIEEVHEPDPRPVLADLARHFAAAVPVGPVDRAVHYGRRAASQAFRAAAYDEAVAHLRAVLDLPLEPTDAGRAARRAGPRPPAARLLRASRAAYAEAFELADAGRCGRRAAAAGAIGFESATHFPGLPGGAGRRAPRPGHRARRRQPDGHADPAAGVVRPGPGDRRPHARRAWRWPNRRSSDARAIDDPESLTVALQALVTALDDPARRLELSDRAGRRRRATGRHLGRVLRQRQPVPRPSFSSAASTRPPRPSSGTGT